MPPEAASSAAARAPDLYAYVCLLLALIEVETAAGQNFLVSAEDEVASLLVLIQDIPGIPPDLRETLLEKARAMQEWLSDRSTDRDRRVVLTGCHSMAQAIRARAVGPGRL